MAVAQKSVPRKRRTALGKFLAAGSSAKGTKVTPKKAGTPKAASDARQRPVELCDWDDADLINESARVAARLTLGK